MLIYELFLKMGKIKKFIADNFVIELNCDGTKLDDINSLELFYESQNKKLLFVFSEKDSSECRLYLEFKSDENIIKSEISGKCIKQNHSLYDFLCDLKHSDLAEDMNIFLSKLSEAEKKLLNKKIEIPIFKRNKSKKISVGNGVSHEIYKKKHVFNAYINRKHGKCKVIFASGSAEIWL